MSSRLVVLIIYILQLMKSTYLTTDEFRKFESKTDARFEAIDKRFDEMHVFIRDCMEEQRIYYAEECKRYVGSISEQFTAKIQTIFEHPIFSQRN